MTHLVMFDVDGTLVDSTGFDGALFARAVRSVLDVEVDETWKEWDRRASAELGYGFVAIGGRVPHEAHARDFADGAALKALLRDPASPGGPNTIKLRR